MAMLAKKIQKAKAEAISDIKARFESVPDYIFAEYRGLTVDQMTDLRRQLGAKGCAFKVVKNNFARIAFEEMKTVDVSSFLIGPTAVALSPEETNTVAKVLFDFAKDAPSLVVKGALVDGEIYDAEKIASYSKLPGRSDLIAMLMSTMQATTSKFVRTLRAVADQKAEA